MRRCRIAVPSLARRLPAAPAPQGRPSIPQSHRRAPRASRFGTMRASRRSVKTSRSPSASVATMGLPDASASNTVSGVPSHRDGKTLRSNALRTSATSRANPTNTKRSPRPSRRACASSGSPERTFADEKKFCVGSPVEHEPGGVHEIGVAFRFVQPRHRADRKIARRYPELPARLRDLFVGTRPAEFVVWRTRDRPPSPSARARAAR